MRKAVKEGVKNKKASWRSVQLETDAEEARKLGKEADYRFTFDTAAVKGRVPEELEKRVDTVRQMFDYVVENAETGKQLRAGILDLSHVMLKARMEVLSEALGVQEMAKKDPEVRQIQAKMRQLDAEMGKIKYDNVGMEDMKKKIGEIEKEFFKISYALKEKKKAK